MPDDNSSNENGGQSSNPPKKKTPPKKKAAKKSSRTRVAAAATPKKPKSVRNYPIITMDKCLIVPQKIKELNGGNPWSPKEIADAINIRDTNKLYYYTAASRDFGFTSGTSQSKEISLTDFGRATLYAPDPETEHKRKIEAFLKISIFKNVLEYYKGSSLPEMKYLSNTLEDKFKLNPDFHEEFSKVFSENCKYLGITSGNSLEDFIGGDAAGQIQPSTITVGETKKGIKTKLKAFVIMPFTERGQNRAVGFFKEVLESLLVPAGIEAGFNVETANKQGSDVIQSTIINDLLEADLVIADLTDHNPNVLFELGMRMANDKPVALIKTKDTGRIFDVDNMLRVYEYNQNLWKSTIEADVPALVEHFKAAWNNRDSDQTYMKILRRVTVAQVP